MMRAVEVAEVASQVNGVSYRKDESFADAGPERVGVLRAGSIQAGDLTLDDVVYVPRERVKDAQLLRKGDVLIATSSGSIDVVGKAAVVREDLPFAFGAFCKVLRPTDLVDPHYFGHFFQTTGYRRYVRSVAAGASINNLRKSHLDTIKFPLPPLAEQRRIAEILDTADELRRKRRRAIEDVEQLRISIFVQMFGDPISNPFGWERTDFSSQFDRIRYGTGSPPPYVDDGVPFVRATDIKRGRVVLNGMKEIAPEHARSLEKCRLATGDMIIVRSGVNTGDCALVPEILDGACAAYDMIISLPSDSAVFYQFYLDSDFGKHILAPMKRRAAQPHLNAQQISTLRLVAPPQELRTEFSARLQEVEQEREAQIEQQALIERLFGSLQQRAFKGNI